MAVPKILLLLFFVLAILHYPAAVLASSAQLLSSGDFVTDFVTQKIDSNKVMVFSKSYCPHCRATKQLLNEINDSAGGKLGVAVVELNELSGDDGPIIQNELLKRTGQRTVPNIFIDRKHIGGNSDLQAKARSGDLYKMLGVDSPPEL